LPVNHLISLLSGKNNELGGAESTTQLIIVVLGHHKDVPLRYFVGDNEHNIKIQINCALIANLLMTVIQKNLKRSWAFSNLAGFCKIHRFIYTQTIRFLKNPDMDLQKAFINTEQLALI